MKSLLRLIAVFLSFTLDVQIRAANNETPIAPEVKNVLQDPEGCFYENVKCAVFPVKERLELTFGVSKVYIKPRTLVIRQSDSEVFLLEGLAYIEAQSQVKIDVIFGTISLNKGDKALVIKTDKSAELMMLSGEARLDIDGEMKPQKLVKGYTLWFSKVKVNGEPSVDLPQPINIYKLMRQWASVYPYGKEEFKAQVRQMHAFLLDVVDASSQWQLQELNRRIASIEAEKERRQKLRAKIEEENRRLRALFRKKTYMDLLDQDR